MRRLNEQLAPYRKELISGPAVDARYDIVAMTRWRWRNDPRLGFPQPIRIRNRLYWRLSELIAWERETAAKSLLQRKGEVA